MKDLLSRIGQWTEKMWRSIPIHLRDAIFTALLLGIAAAICFVLRSIDENGSFTLLIFVLAVVIISRFTEGYFWGVFSSLFGVICVNFVFTYPFWAFNFRLTGYPLTFLTMLVVSLVTCTMTTKIKRQEDLRIEAAREKMRANLLRSVSHDIRTPLALILGWGEQLQQDEALPAAARQKAAGICTQSEKIRSLIGDLNLTSKLQYGAQPLRRKAVTVGPFLRRCAAEFYESPAAGDSTLELELTQAAEHTVVQADEALLLRAIENLLHNTVGHNAAPVHVTIRADAADGMLTIQVTDDGQGYPPAVLAALKESESSEDAPHILGLHVVEQIAAAHGGTAVFEQNHPHGARAVIRLPLGELARSA